MITGETRAAEKAPGTRLPASSEMPPAPSFMRAEPGRQAPHCWPRSSQMVAEAQRSRAPIRSGRHRFSGWFVPVVIVAALLTSRPVRSFGPPPR